MDQSKGRSGTDRSAFIAASIAAAAMIAVQVGAKAVRDALFLTEFDVTLLPTMVIGASVVSIVLVLPNSRLMTRFGPARVMPLGFLISGGLLIFEWLLSFSSPRATVIVFYLHVAALGPFLISGFWSLVNERFDPRSAKRRIGRIVGGATFGGLVGGILADQLGGAAGAAAVLPVLALFHAFCAWRIRLLRPVAGLAPRKNDGERDPTESRAKTPGDSSKNNKNDSNADGLGLLRTSSYLRNIALLVFLGTMTAGLLDYALKDAASQAFRGEGRAEALIRFFAVFHTGSSLLTFLVQHALSRRLLERLGLARAIATLPGAMAVGSLAAVFLPGLVTMTLVRGGEYVLRSSIFRSSYELLYTPVDPSKKRAVKSIIDVGFDRLGDAAGAGVVQLLFVFARSWQATALLVLATISSLVSLWIASLLRRGYVRSLEKSLVRQAFHLEMDEISDSTTRSVVLQTMGNIDRRELAKLARPAGDSQNEPGSSSPIAAADSGDSFGTKQVAISTRSDAPQLAGSDSAGSSRGTSHDPTIQATLILRSGNPVQIRSYLEGVDELSAELVAHVIPLLAWDAVSEVAVRGLRLAAKKSTGQLIDALVDAEQEFAVRRRIPRTLVAFSEQRTVNGLLLGLRDRRFEVRYQCGRALAIIHNRNRELVFGKREVYEAASRELAVETPIWESRRLLDTPGKEDEDAIVIGMGEVLAERASRSLEHLFTLLSLVLETKPLQIAYKGILTKDPYLRGTALEYLESVLPSSIRVSLWPFLEDRRGTSKKPATHRPREQVLADLMKSHESIAINLEELRRQVEEAKKAEPPSKDTP